MKGVFQQTASTIMSSIGDGVTAVIGYAGDVVEAITSGGLSALLPVIGMAIGIGIVGWGIRTVKSLTWGF